MPKLPPAAGLLLEVEDYYQNRILRGQKPPQPGRRQTLSEESYNLLLNVINKKILPQLQADEEEGTEQRLTHFVKDAFTLTQQERKKANPNSTDVPSVDEVLTWIESRLYTNPAYNPKYNPEGQLSVASHLKLHKIAAEIEQELIKKASAPAQATPVAEVALDQTPGIEPPIKEQATTPAEEEQNKAEAPTKEAAEEPTQENPEEAKTDPGQIKVETANPEKSDRRVYIVIDGEMVATWVNKEGYNRALLADNASRAKVVSDILATKLEGQPPYDRLIDKLNAERAAQGKKLISSKPKNGDPVVEVTNLYPGLPKIFAVATNFHFNDAGITTSYGDGANAATSERIHERREAIAFIESGRWQTTPESAIELAVANNTSSKNFQRNPQTGDIAVQSITQLTTQKAVNPETVVAVIRHTPAGNTEYAIGANGVRDRNRTTPPKDPSKAAWSLEEMAKFVGAAVERADTADEQWTYVREFSAWCQRYEHNVPGDNLGNPPESFILNELAERINKAEIARATITIDKETKYVQLSHYINKATMREKLATDPYHFKLLRDQSQLANPTSHSSPEAVPETASALDRDGKPIHMPLIRGNSYRDPAVILELERTKAALTSTTNPAERLRIYREISKLLTDQDRISLIKSTQDKGLLLAIARDPLSVGDVRKALADYAPAGDVGEEIQLNALREALLEGGGRTVMDLIRIEPRGAVASEIVERLSTEGKENETHKAWVAKLQGPEGLVEWSHWIDKVKAEVGEKRINQERTGKIVGEFVGYNHKTKTYSIRLDNGYVVEVQAGKRTSIDDKQLIASLEEDVYQRDGDKGTIETRGPKVSLVTNNAEGKKILYCIQRQELQAELADTDLVRHGGHSAFHLSSEEVQENLTNYVQLTAERARLQMILADIQKDPAMDPEKACQGIINSFRPPAADSEERKAKHQVGMLEFALSEKEEDPQNPLPGKNDTEKQDSRSKSAILWKQSHREMIHGRRDANKRLILNNRQQPITPGLLKTLVPEIETEFRGKIPPQDLTKVAQVKNIERGVAEAEIVLTKYEQERTKPFTHLTEMDKAIAKLHGGKSNPKLPTTVTEYVKLRIEVLSNKMQQTKKAAVGSVKKSAEYEQFQLGNKAAIANEINKGIQNPTQALQSISTLGQLI